MQNIYERQGKQAKIETSSKQKGTNLGGYNLGPSDSSAITITISSD